MVVFGEIMFWCVMAGEVGSVLVDQVGCGTAGGLRLLVVLYVGVSYVKVRQARRVAVRLGTSSWVVVWQVCWGQLSFGLVRFGEAGLVRLDWVRSGLVT